MLLSDAGYWWDPYLTVLRLSTKDISQWNSVYFVDKSFHSNVVRTIFDTDLQ